MGKLTCSIQAYIYTYVRYIDGAERRTNKKTRTCETNINLPRADLSSISSGCRFVAVVQVELCPSDDWGGDGCLGRSSCQIGVSIWPSNAI